MRTQSCLYLNLIFLCLPRFVNFDYFCTYVAQRSISERNTSTRVAKPIRKSQSIGRKQNVSVADIEREIEMMIDAEHNDVDTVTQNVQPDIVTVNDAAILLDSKPVTSELPVGHAQHQTTSDLKSQSSHDYVCKALPLVVVGAKHNDADATKQIAQPNVVAADVVVQLDSAPVAEEQAVAHVPRVEPKSTDSTAETSEPAPAREDSIPTSAQSDVLQTFPETDSCDGLASILVPQEIHMKLEEAQKQEDGGDGKRALELYTEAIRALTPIYKQNKQLKPFVEHYFKRAFALREQYG
eukprot:SAG31_NODE_2004_length_6685_cov_2.189341_2_plen_296_part_00